MRAYVKSDTAAVDAMILEVGARKAKSVAASVLTSLARQTRTAGLQNLQATTGMSKNQLGKRIRVFRANPKAPPQDMASGIVVSEYQVREILLGARQTGHPGRPRHSSTDAAKAARKRRKLHGAKAPRAGGVNTTGRKLPGRWIGTARRGGRGKVNVLERRPNGAVARVFRDFQGVARYFERATGVATKLWPEQYGAALQRAIDRAGRRR